MRNLRPVAAAVLALGCLVTACSSGGDSGDATTAGGESEVIGPANEGIEGVQSIRVYYSSPIHTESIVHYQLRPPAGGMHNPIWWNCGFYDEAIPDEHAVHDLEHGAVWLAYAPDLPAADLEVIHDLARANPKVIASSYPDLRKGEAVVATAWARQLRLDTVDDPRLAEFVAQYQDGPQAPESGSSCTGSPLGDPIP
jgi:Protein of unknown function (DUF3105)